MKESYREIVKPLRKFRAVLICGSLALLECFNRGFSKNRPVAKYVVYFVLRSPGGKFTTCEKIDFVWIVISIDEWLMSWFRKSLKGLIDPLAAGESMIETQEKIYRQTQQKSPGVDPHQILAGVYLSRMRTHGKDTRNEETRIEALTRTYTYACLPFPQSIRVLGIAFIQFERPDIMKQCPSLSASTQN